MGLVFGSKWWEKTKTEKELRVHKQEVWRDSENNDSIVGGRAEYSMKRR